MTEKRKESVFWLDNECPFCGHSAPLVYKPDLLKGPIEFECASKNNPLRINWPCSGRWSVAIEIAKKDELGELMALAERQDALYAEIGKNRIVLGYK